MTRKTLGISRDTEATKASRSWAVTGVRLERLKERLAIELGYDLIGHRLELYGVKRGRAKSKE